MSDDLTNKNAAPTEASVRRSRFYSAAWRWHFYAGLYVIPFFVMLAATGLAMMWLAHLNGRDGERIQVAQLEAALPVSQQAAAALGAVPGGVVTQYVAPRTADLAAIFRVDAGDGATMVALDPYTAEVLAQFPRRSGWYDLMDEIHGSLMLGVTGDLMIEIAASLGVMLIVTGVYMWWPRKGGAVKALTPRLAAKRTAWWKSLHSVFGAWTAVFLFFFLISGLSWAGVWGGQFVQAWSSFPAGKWGGAPQSDVTHASMNLGPKEVPWALEQTPMPASGSLAGENGVKPGIALTIDTIDAFAREIGFEGRYQLNLPKGEAGVWTLSRDSMNTDSLDPTTDRTTHIDQYTGKILADIRYEDYSVMGKAMAVGVALHMGTLGLWSVLANTLLCLLVIFLCVSGAVMWWLRRPAGSVRLAPPPLPQDMPHWGGAALLGLVIAMAFPMAGLTMIGVMALDGVATAFAPALKRSWS